MKQGIQLYTLRDSIQTYEDADRTFAALKDFGCDVIQISGIGDIEPHKVALLVEKYGFDVCVTHKPFDRIRDDLDALIEEHKMIGCDMIGMGSMPDEYRGDPEKVLEFARFADETGKKMRAKGMKLAYHNHDFEFKAFSDGKNSMDILLENTDPENLKLIPDVAWAAYAGNEPCGFLERISDRVKVVHMKDYIIDNGKIKFIEFGKGLVDFGQVYKKCFELNIPYAVYEQDRDWNTSPLDSCKYSYSKMLETAAAFE